MTQPTLRNADSFDWNGFPDPAPNDIQALTAAIRDLAEAIRQDPDGPTIRVSAVERGCGMAGDFSPEAWEDPDIERVDTKDGAAVDAWWYDEAQEFKPKAGEGVEIGHVHAAFTDRTVQKTLADVPEGWVAVLDPPRLLPEDAAEAVDIYAKIWVRKVWRERWEDNDSDWMFLDKTETDGDGPWIGDVRQIEALGLTYADFHPPA